MNPYRESDRVPPNQPAPTEPIPFVVGEIVVLKSDPTTKMIVSAIDQGKTDEPILVVWRKPNGKLEEWWLSPAVLMRLEETPDGRLQRAYEASEFDRQRATKLADENLRLVRQVEDNRRASSYVQKRLAHYERAILKIGENVDRIDSTSIEAIRTAAPPLLKLLKETIAEMQYGRTD